MDLETKREYMKAITLIVALLIVGWIANAYLENAGSYEAQENLIKQCNEKINSCNSNFKRCFLLNNSVTQQVNWSDFFGDLNATKQ